MLATNVIDSSYTEKIIKVCMEYWKKNVYICETLLELLAELVKIYKKIPEVLNIIEV